MAATLASSEKSSVEDVKRLTQFPHNKLCCDCWQPGPTYANTTIGSFVCMTCSGHLRGLNPPQRVKSISMSTFSQQELDVLTRFGNKISNLIWLGKVADVEDHKRSIVLVQNRKMYLRRKYESKTWRISDQEAVHILTKIPRQSSTVLTLTASPSAPPSGLRVVPRPQSLAQQRPLNASFDSLECGRVKAAGGVASRAQPTDEMYFFSSPLEVTAAAAPTAASIPAQSCQLRPSKSVDEFTNFTYTNYACAPKSPTLDDVSFGTFQATQKAIPGGYRCVGPSADKYAALAELGRGPSAGGRPFAAIPKAHSVCFSSLEPEMSHPMSSPSLASGLPGAHNFGFPTHLPELNPIAAPQQPVTANLPHGMGFPEQYQQRPSHRLPCEDDFRFAPVQGFPTNLWMDPTAVPSFHNQLPPVQYTGFVASAAASSSPSVVYPYAIQSMPGVVPPPLHYLYASDGHQGLNQFPAAATIHQQQQPFLAANWSFSAAANTGARPSLDLFGRSSAPSNQDAQKSNKNPFL